MKDQFNKMQEKYEAYGISLDDQAGDILTDTRGIIQAPQGKGKNTWRTI